MGCEPAPMLDVGPPPATRSQGSRNDFVRRMLVKFDYGALGKGGKGLLLRFLLKATGLSRAQLTSRAGC